MSGLAALVWWLLMAAFASEQPRDLVPMSVADAEMKRVEGCLRGWTKDVINRDVDRLVKRTWPEYQPAVRRELLGDDGRIHAALYGGEKPVVSLLQTTTTRVTVFKHLIHAEGVYAVGCFAPGSVALSGFKTFADLQRSLAGRNDRFCVSLVLDQAGACNIDYTFGGELRGPNVGEADLPSTGTEPRIGIPR